MMSTRTLPILFLQKSWTFAIRQTTLNQRCILVKKRLRCRQCRTNVVSIINQRCSNVAVLQRGFTNVESTSINQRCFDVDCVDSMTSTLFGRRESNVGTICSERVMLKAVFYRRENQQLCLWKS